MKSFLSAAVVIAVCLTGRNCPAQFAVDQTPAVNIRRDGQCDRFSVKNRRTGARNDFRAVPADAFPRPVREKGVARAPVQKTVRAAAPSRLSAAELDRGTGKVTWPSALAAESFADGRADLENLLKDRCSRPVDAAGEINGEIRGRASRMKEQLKGIIRALPTREYLSARRFLDALAMEFALPLRGQAG
jgi:hypothetical protein